MASETCAMGGRASAYGRHGDCIAAEYTQNVPEAGVKQDGRLIQGGHTADSGGTRIALEELKKEKQIIDCETSSGWPPTSGSLLLRVFLVYRGPS